MYRAHIFTILIGTTLSNLFAYRAFAVGPDELSHKLAFLKNGEVWISDVTGREMKQITNDSGKVDDFLFSPPLTYLAYAKVIGYEDEPGLWDDAEKVPQQDVCSIVIVDLTTLKVIKELMPTEDRWIYIARWLPREKFMYYSSSGFDVSGFYTYDVQNGAKSQIDYDKSGTITSTEYSADGTLKTYVDDSGLGKDFSEHLHLVDVKTNSDRIIVSRRSIADHTLSNDKNVIAFVEVEELGKQYFDKLWVYNIREDSLKLHYRGPAKAKIGGESQLRWSDDDRYIGMFFSPEALVLDVRDPEKTHRIGGTNFAWMENHEIVFAQGDSGSVYSLGTRQRNVIMHGVSKPTFLRQRNY